MNWWRACVRFLDRYFSKEESKRKSGCSSNSPVVTFNVTKVRRLSNHSTPKVIVSNLICYFVNLRWILRLVKWVTRYLLDSISVCWFSVTNQRLAITLRSLSCAESIGGSGCWLAHVCFYRFVPYIGVRFDVIKLRFTRQRSACKYSLRVIYTCTNHTTINSDYMWASHAWTN